MVINTFPTNVFAREYWYGVIKHSNGQYENVTLLGH